MTLIDLRSDTVTKPTPEMHAAMMTAEVGDDVLGEDPTVRVLEQKAAALFGLEAGLFCPSGTMTNQIAIRVQTQPQQEVICHEQAHIYLYEGGGIAYNSLASVRLLGGERGILSAEAVAQAINPDDDHYPETALVALENTMNKGGGSCYTTDQIAAIHTVCQQHGLPLHLDGARVFNALVATGEEATTYGRYFSSISVCLSKGLGAPVGSVLLGSKALIRRARRVRKVFGGGMRQAGYLAAAGIYALDHHVQRLADDHRRAAVLAEALSAQPYVQEVLPVETNIVIFTLREQSPAQWVETLKQRGVLAIPFGKQQVRMVTHLGVTDKEIDQVIEVMRSL
ncbi:MAG: GntG family PLP-dependent aldolase [Tunicatimonas sp.]